MEKVWFKLRQTDYPPEKVDSMGSGTETSPICIGYFIPDLKQIDFPLNRGEIKEFPANLEVYPTRSVDFDWTSYHAAETGGGLGAGAPIAGAVGVELKASVQATFRREVSDHEKYDRLDTYIVQPDRSYVADCLRGDKLSEFVRAHHSWSMFMITGVKVARSGTRTTSESSKRQFGAEVAVDVPGVVSKPSQTNTNVAREHSQQFGGLQTSDFVWAVRLAKVSQGILRKDWSIKPYTKRATFAAEEKEVIDVVRLVADEDLGGFQVIEHEEMDEALVIM